METKKLKRIHRYSSAKINLFLDVIQKREDGFHDIRTVFTEIELADTLNFTLTKKNNIRILANKDFVSTQKNLIYKVAIFIKNRYKVTDGVDIELEKNIPIAAGLGGGSSNAAQTILALSELWDLNLSQNEMHEIAGNFGSDINFFLEGGCALGEGRGEQIKSLTQINIDNIFLVNPGFGISSREAYEAVNLSGQENPDWKKLLETGDVNFCYNKLEEGICERYPEIANIINYMQTNGATKAMLSGSGATVIGFCPDTQTAKNLAKHFSKNNYWNLITKTKQ